MVLEMRATPYIFTFKLWDWGRLGLDGRPRPIHLKHEVRNIQWDTTEWVKHKLINQVQIFPKVLAGVKRERVYMSPNSSKREGIGLQRRSTITLVVG